MADTIQLPDGSVEVIFCRDDFQRLVTEKLGWGAEQKLKEIIDEADYTQAKVGTDLNSYEASLESNRYCFLELQDTLEKMKTLVDAKRINKDRLRKLIKQMETSISNQV